MAARLRELFWPIMFLAALLLLAWWNVYVQEQYRVFDNPEDHSSYAPDTGGTLALYRLLEAEGFEVRRWSRGTDQLSQRESVLIIVNGHQYLPRTIAEGAAPLAAWIRAGGTLVVFGVEGPAESFVAHVKAQKKWVSGRRPKKSGPLDYTYTASAMPAPHTRGLSSFQGEGGFRLKGGGPWRPFARDARGVVAEARQLGKGWVVLFADVNMATNRGLAKADNAPLLIQTAGLHARRGSAVVFEEAGWGHHGEEAPLDRFGSGGRLLVWQFLAALTLALVGTGKRFGLVRPRRPKQPSAGEYAAAIGGLYRKAGASALALEVIYQDVLRRLSNKLKAPPDLPERELIRRAPPELHEALEQCRAAGNEGLDERQLLVLVRNLDKAAKQANLR
jgi:hypothetical protein